MQNRKYFQGLQLKKAKNKINANNNIIEINEKVQNEIQQGKILIEQQSIQKKSRIQQLSNKIQSKKDQLKKQLELLSLSLKRKSHSVRAYNRKKSEKAISLRSHRSRSGISEEDFQQYQKKKVQASQRLKQLKKLRDIASQKRKQIQKKRLQRLQSENSKRQKEERDQKQKQKQQKLKAIREKIKQFQQNKQIRLSRLKQSLIKSSPHLPKFKQMKSDFDNQQQRLKSERRSNYKKDIHSKFQEYKFQEINKHQKQYIQKLKQKFVRVRRAKTQDNAKEKLQKQLGFKLIGKDQQSLREGQIKLLKMKEFERVQNKIKINVNLHKNMEILIAKDKAENPMKYIFLRQKNLNDYQIYKDFKNFNMEVDAKQLGNSYLNQVIKQNRKLASTQRNNSQIAVKTEASSSERKQYKNYLQHGKKNARKKQADEVQILFQQYGDKSKVVQVLQQRSQLKKAQALEKIGKMRKLKTYGQAVEIQKQIDSDYINSIKVKLKCIGIK